MRGEEEKKEERGRNGREGERAKGRRWGKCSQSLCPGSGGQEMKQNCRKAVMDGVQRSLPSLHCIHSHRVGFGSPGLQTTGVELKRKSSSFVFIASCICKMFKHQEKRGLLVFV